MSLSLTDDAPDGQELTFTKFYNVILDGVVPYISGSEWKILTVVLRKTVGFQDPTTGKPKITDEISYSQFMVLGGIKDPHTVHTAVVGLETKRILSVVHSTDRVTPNVYGLDLAGVMSFVKATGKIPAPEKFQTQKKLCKDTKEEEPTASVTLGAINGYPDDRDPDVVNYHRKDPDNRINRASTDSYLNHELVLRVTRRDAL